MVNVPAVSIISSTRIATSAGDFADDIHLGDDVGSDPPFIDDRERRIQPRRDGARALDAAGIGRHDRHFIMIQLLLQMFAAAPASHRRYRRECRKSPGSVPK